MRRIGWTGGSWLLLAPFLLGSLVLVVGPALASLALAFTEYDGLAPPRWTGLGTFERLFAYAETSRALSATAWFLLLAVPLRVGGALALALLLHGRERFSGAGRLAAYAPAVLPDAATALVWLWVVNPVYGPLAAVVTALGGTPTAVLLDPWGARLVLVGIAVLGLGEGFLVALAARREVPPVLYDVARLEGARGPRLLRLVTLPVMAPVLGLLVARDLVMSMQVTVVPALLLTQGGPLGATKTLPLLAYERGFRELRFGDAAAVSLLLLVGTLLVVAVQQRLLRRWLRAGAAVTGGG